MLSNGGDGERGERPPHFISDIINTYDKKTHAHTHACMHPRKRARPARTFHEPHRACTSSLASCRTRAHSLVLAPPSKADEERAAAPEAAPMVCERALQARALVTAARQAVVNGTWG